MRFVLVLLAVLMAPIQALASTCFAFVDGVPGIKYASLGQVAAAAGEVEIVFVGHSTFQITTPAGVTIATDYFGLKGPAGVPNVVTMNQAHSTHYTDRPDPGIEHVLRGWRPDRQGPAEHQITIKDVTVRNVTTDIRGFGGLGEDGNSIFVFEVAELCIAHLGHLHHPLTEGQFAALGRMDILMVPVDGTWTMAVDEMITLAKRVKARIVLPMHAFGAGSLQRFTEGMGDEFAIRQHGPQPLVVSVETLPSEPEVAVMLPARYAR